GSLKETVRQAFAESDAIWFIGATGIAVRAIAPFVKSKLEDPAVLVSDELGTFIIPLLSGHVGGANDLATTFARHFSMIPVITTATDIHGVISIDSWAVKKGYSIENPSKIKDVSMKVLRGERIDVWSDVRLDDIPREFHLLCNGCGDSDTAETLPHAEEMPDVYIGHKTPAFLGEKTLCLTPKTLYVGIGCKRGTSEEAIASLFEEVFTAHRLSEKAVIAVSSIDLKADEEGLLAFCRKRGYPVCFYSAEDLTHLRGEYVFSMSPFVKGVTGVDSVCERAAVKSAEVRESGFERVELLCKKTAKNGVTVAVAKCRSLEGYAVST
ncbi:MAG: cobalamin biosynthesis protein, partial [Bacillota bacterium]|nr:cobalamin biosynthesis protein [Bacillota bacterium]